MGEEMLTLLLVKTSVGILMFGLYRPQVWSMRRWNGRARVALGEGFGNAPVHRHLEASH
jgi:hypothetical protein